MKNKLLFIAALYAFTNLAFCHANKQRGQANAANPEYKQMIQQQNIAQYLAQKLKNCCSLQQCGTSDDYCNDPKCKLVVMKCHTVTPDTFAMLIQGQDGVSDTFTLSQINIVLRASTCKNQKIELFVEDDTDETYYQVVNVNRDYIDTKHQYYGFYSHLLLQTLVDSGLQKLWIYKGISNGNGKNIVPFEVLNSGGILKYYDVSDTQP